MSKQTDQQKHPEIMEGERFIGNSWDQGFEINVEGKRIGTVAYDTSGETIKGAVPVFVPKKATS